MAAVYLGCAGTWSALCPGFLNVVALLCMYGFFNPTESAKDVDKNKTKRAILSILPGVVSVIFFFLMLGIFNVVNLTFALFLVINIIMATTSYVLGMCCKNKVQHLYSRFIYASGFVATVTFAFLIAFKVVSLATVVPFVAPSLAFALLCFLRLVIMRFEEGKCGCLNLCTLCSQNKNEQMTKENMLKRNVELVQDTSRQNSDENEY